MRYYISFWPYYDREPDHWIRSAWVDRVREWLNDTAGEEELKWKWSRGDLLANGVRVEEEEIAILLKLRFGL